MSTSEGTTKIEIKNTTLAALDKRKKGGDNFDDVIQRLMDNSAVMFGGLKNIEEPTELGDIERDWLDDIEPGGCDYADPITGQFCNDKVSCRQGIRWEGDEEIDYLYYCETHAPQGSNGSGT
jgi:predicted CopG family antitoxin